jgi:hypothetical protein
MGRVNGAAILILHFFSMVGEHSIKSRDKAQSNISAPPPRPNYKHDFLVLTFHPTKSNDEGFPKETRSSTGFSEEKASQQRSHRCSVTDRAVIRAHHSFSCE